jgi:hypothetical protein
MHAMQMNKFDIYPSKGPIFWGVTKVNVIGHVAVTVDGCEKQPYLLPISIGSKLLFD